MFKRKVPIKTKISEISRIKMGFYVTFYYEDNSICYKGYDDTKFIIFLEENELCIEWNKIGKYLTKNMIRKN
jgi:hypothetical protein